MHHHLGRTHSQLGQELNHTLSHVPPPRHCWSANNHSPYLFHLGFYTTHTKKTLKLFFFGQEYGILSFKEILNNLKCASILILL